MDLEGIYAPVQEDLLKVEEKLNAVSRIEAIHLSELLSYSLEGTGKMMRPALTLLSGKFYEYNIVPLLDMATSVELMHTATLIHDDAIDNSMTRRGRETVFNIWGVDEAVLLGDYLFAEAGRMTAATENLRVITQFSETLKTISSGEINQAYYSFVPDQRREQYFKRIAQKTAALFSLSTESGAVLSNAPEESIRILTEYGYNLGIGFQIVDDILDFIGTEEELGKPVGSDLSQGTITLPSLMILERYPGDNPVIRIFEKQGGQEEIDKTIEMVINSDIVKECYNVAENYCARACRDLDKLPDTVSRVSLKELAGYITLRRK